MTAPLRKRSLLLIASYIVAPLDDCRWCERTSVAHRAVLRASSGGKKGEKYREVILVIGRHPPCAWVAEKGVEEGI